MKIVNKREAKMRAVVKYRQRDCYGNPVYKTKTLYLTDIPLHPFLIGCIDSDKIREYAIYAVRNQQMNIETFTAMSVTLAIKNCHGDFIPAV